MWNETGDFRPPHWNGLIYLCVCFIGGEWDPVVSKYFSSLFSLSHPYLCLSLTFTWGDWIMRVRVYIKLLLLLHWTSHSISINKKSVVQRPEAVCSNNFPVSFEWLHKSKNLSPKIWLRLTDRREFWAVCCLFSIFPIFHCLYLPPSLFSQSQRCKTPLCVVESDTPSCHPDLMEVRQTAVNKLRWYGTCRGRKRPCACPRKTGSMNITFWHAQARSGCVCGFVCGCVCVRGVCRGVYPAVKSLHYVHIHV